MQSFSQSTGQVAQIQNQVNQDAALDKGSNAQEFSEANQPIVPRTNFDPKMPTARPLNGGGMVFLVSPLSKKENSKAYKIQAANADLAGAQFLRMTPKNREDMNGIVEYAVKDGRLGRVYYYRGTWEPILSSNVILQNGGFFDKKGRMRKLETDEGRKVQPKRFFTQELLGESGCGCGM